MQSTKLNWSNLVAEAASPSFQAVPIVIQKRLNAASNSRFDVREVRMPRLLIVEDSPAMVYQYQGFLSKEPYDVEVAETLKQAIEKIGDSAPDLVLLDIQLPDGDGLAVLDTLVAQKSDAKVVVMTAHGSVNVAVEAMQRGAYDFVVKPFNQERIVRTLHNALEAKSLQKQVEEFKKTERPKYHSIIGSSLPMQSVYRTIDAAAPTDATVFITGETGTGKELVAQSVHAQSKRRAKNCVVLNCAAIPKDLMESEIFGHVKGAFTGATDNRDGAAHLANNGTLFLDEIGEMDMALQSKLLRFLQSGTFNRVGSSKMEEVDIRIVCATNRDPWGEVKRGNFREDLYYRLNVIPISLPALRERGDDIVEIAERFLGQIASEVGKTFEGLDGEVKTYFKTYYWPGNIRQLQNVVRNIVVLNEGPLVTMSMLPPLESAPHEAASYSVVSTFNPSANPAQTGAPTPGAAVISSATHTVVGGSEPGSASPLSEPNGELMPMWKVEQVMIDSALEKCGGNVNKAAAMLEISPSSVYRKRSGDD